jgi:LPXTG-motif cell wall-anchored protein
MLAAIDTNTVSDFFQDHPGEAYAIVGALVLLLILLLLVRRRRTKEADTGGQVSRRDRGQGHRARARAGHQARA